MRRTLTVASVAGAVLAAPLAGLAGAADVHVTVLQTGGLHARGAGMAVQVSVTCSPGEVGFVDVLASQRVSQTAVYSGSSTTPVRCDGSAHRMRVGVVPRDPNTGSLTGPFKVGPAFVTATLSVCAGTCASSRDTRTVDVQAITLNTPWFVNPTLAVHLPDRGTVAARGAGAVVRISYRCSTGAAGTFSATLVQRTPTDTLISATAQLGATCDGRDRTGVLGFHAPGVPWHAGPVFVLLTGSFCGDQGCFDPRALRTLSLVKPA